MEHWDRYDSTQGFPNGCAKNRGHCICCLFLTAQPVSLFLFKRLGQWVLRKSPTHALHHVRERHYVEGIQHAFPWHWWYEHFFIKHFIRWWSLMIRQYMHTYIYIFISHIMYIYIHYITLMVWGNITPTFDNFNVRLWESRHISSSPGPEA